MADKPLSQKENQAPQSAALPTITLDEFCQRLSETVRRPELIAGFYSTASASGAHADTQAGYQSRFDIFINTPV